jgi:hypothetical protein
MGREHVGKGVNVALGPMMNIGRVAGGGRNWEGFGADPFLAGEAAYETIIGMQEGGVQACAKHLINKWVSHFGFGCPRLTGASAVSRSISARKRARTSTTGRSMKSMRTHSCGVSWPASLRAY